MFSVPTATPAAVIVFVGRKPRPSSVACNTDFYYTFCFNPFRRPSKTTWALKTRTSGDNRKRWQTFQCFRALCCFLDVIPFKLSCVRINGFTLFRKTKINWKLYFSAKRLGNCFIDKTTWRSIIFKTDKNYSHITVTDKVDDVRPRKP